MLQINYKITAFGYVHVAVAAFLTLLDVVCAALAFYIHKLTSTTVYRRATFVQKKARLFQLIADMTATMVFDETLKPIHPRQHRQKSHPAHPKPESTKSASSIAGSLARTLNPQGRKPSNSARGMPMHRPGPLGTTGRAAVLAHANPPANIVTT